MWNHWLLDAALACGVVAPTPAGAADSGLATVAAESGNAANVASFDGVVEAVRQTVVAAQVAGAVVALEVKAGDEIYGPEADGRREVAKSVRALLERTPGVVDVDDSSIAAAPRTVLLVDRRKSALLSVSQQAVVTTLRAGLAGEAATWLHDETKYPAAATLQLPAERQGDLDGLLQLEVRGAEGELVPIRELVTRSDTQREQPAHHKDLLPVNYVVADMAGRVDSPLYGVFGMRNELAGIDTPGGGKLDEYFIRQPSGAWRGYAIKWDGEWQVTYETFRDMGAAYAVGLVLIYLLVVAQFGSYLTPLIIMAPIPLTIIGVLPGHALLGAQYTATSMIGMIALAGIIVRNSILLVDFVRRGAGRGKSLRETLLDAGAVRFKPILLTALSAMIGAATILSDPIFQGLAISLLFGLASSTLLTVLVIPAIYVVLHDADGTPGRRNEEGEDHSIAAT